MKTHQLTSLVSPFAVLAAVSVGSGCGAANDLSREDAWRVAQAMGASTGEMQEAGSDSFIVRQVSVDYSVTCPGGGSIALSGDSTLDTGDGSGTGTYSLAASASYEACTLGELTIDASATLTIEAAASNGAGTASAALSGSAFFSGLIEGSCTFDYSVTASADQSGATVHAYAGEICGFDVGELQADYEGNAELTWTVSSEG